MAVASVAVDAATETIVPGSEDEAIAAFGDGVAVVVVGGGTIVVPDLTYRRIRPSKALMLGHAGLAGIETDGAQVTIGAMTPVQDLVDLPAPLGPCAANVADFEIRSQGTVGGNLCAGEGAEAPRGDLQGAFLALAATVRSAADGEVVEEPLEDFFGKRAERLVLERERRGAGGRRLRRSRPAARARLHRTRSVGREGKGRHGSPGRDRGGSWGARLPSAEAAAGDPEAAGKAALEDVSPHDDALASAWYRTKVLPVLVRRVLTDLEESS